MHVLWQCSMFACSCSVAVLSGLRQHEAIYLMSTSMSRKGSEMLRIGGLHRNRKQGINSCSWSQLSRFVNFSNANCRRFLVQVLRIRLHVPTIGIATYQYAKCSKMAINVTSSIMRMCSVAASGSAAASLHRNIEAFPESCMVASVFAGISGVCFVAGPFSIVRFASELFWSSGLLLIEPIECNAARKHVDKPKELESISHVQSKEEEQGRNSVWVCECMKFVGERGSVDECGCVVLVVRDVDWVGWCDNVGD